MTREQLEKQILVIIKNLREFTSISELEECAKNCNQSVDDYVDCEEAREIASLIEQKPDCYSKDFVEWWFSSNHFFSRIERIEPPIFVNFKDGSKVQYTPDELFIYWQTNIKEK